MPIIGIKSSAALTLVLVTCVTTAWTTSVSAQVRVASCADIPLSGADLTSNPSFDIELQRDPATADGNARLAFTLEQADNDELSLSINGGNGIVLDDVNAGGFEFARAYYFDFDRDNLNAGTNTVAFEYTPGNGAVLRRLCIVLRDPDVPDPRPLEETYCSSPNAYNAVTGDGPNSTRVDNMDWDNADLTIPAGAITETSVVGLFGAVRANGADEDTTRTFHFRNDDNPAAEIVIDYSGIVPNETAVLFAATNVTDFFPDNTPDLSMTSSHSANVHELCVVVSNDGPQPGPEPEPEPIPDAGVDVDGGEPVDGGGPTPDGGPAPEPDPEPSGGPGVTPTPDTPTPETPTPDTPTPDAPTPDAPTPDAPTPDTPTPDATPGVTPGPNAGEPSPRPETGEPEGSPEGEVENPLGQGFAVSSCASSSAPGSVPFFFSALVFAAYALFRRRKEPKANA